MKAQLLFFLILSGSLFSALGEITMELPPLKEESLPVETPHLLADAKLATNSFFTVTPFTYTLPENAQGLEKTVSLTPSYENGGVFPLTFYAEILKKHPTYDAFTCSFGTGDSDFEALLLKGNRLHLFRYFVTNHNPNDKAFTFIRQFESMKRDHFETILNDLTEVNAQTIIDFTKPYKGYENYLKEVSITLTEEQAEKIKELFIYLKESRLSSEPLSLNRFSAVIELILSQCLDGQPSIKYYGLDSNFYGAKPVDFDPQNGMITPGLVIDGFVQTMLENFMDKANGWDECIIPAPRYSNARRQSIINKALKKAYADIDSLTSKKSPAQKKATKDPQKRSKREKRRLPSLQ